MNKKSEKSQPKKGGGYLKSEGEKSEKVEYLNFAGWRYLEWGRHLG